MEIVTGIGDFLPDPVGAIMQPIAGIFNTIFGIGEGPTAEEVIREVCHSFLLLNITLETSPVHKYSTTRIVCAPWFL